MFVYNRRQIYSLLQDLFHSDIVNFGDKSNSGVTSYVVMFPKCTAGSILRNTWKSTNVKVSKGSLRSLGSDQV